MKNVTELVTATDEVIDANLAFLRETRNGNADVDQGNLAAKVSRNVLSGVNTHIKAALSAGKLQEASVAA